MATLEDKILGNPRENYCSSSEESGHEDSDNDEGKEDGASAPTDPTPAPPPVKEWNGTASNTGPKGVLNDWEQFKAYETQARRDKEMQRAIHLSKLALTCASAEEEAKRKAREEAEKHRKEELEEELRELEEDDDFLLEYQRKKMKQLYDGLISGREGERKTFGSLIRINSSDAYLSCIETEPSYITVLIHLSSPILPSCRSLDSALSDLARSYPTNTKFVSCPLGCVSEHLSGKFKASALPCLLVYRGGEVMASFVKLGEELGEGFLSEDVEGFLVDHGVLVGAQATVPGILRGARRDDDSD
ncbi:hypothetical protein WDU94_002916 [Cyamophila willieti]